MIARNLPELFIKQANKYSKKIAFEYRLRRNEPYKSISWERLLVIVQEIAYGLVKLGVRKGDRVAIISDTRYEWAACDLGILSCGGVVVPIYPTLGEEAVEYIINNSGCEIVVIENKGQLQKIRGKWERLPSIKHAIVMDDFGDLPEYDKRILSLGGLKDIGKLNFSNYANLVGDLVKTINPEDLATIIYTSGTTGQPKGVELTHKNILSVLSVLPQVLPLKPNDKFLSFLPLSHVFERVGGLYYALSSVTTVCYCSSIDQIGSSLKSSGATIMCVVPRLLEKIFYKLNKQIDSLPEKRKQLTNFAINTGKTIWKNKNNNTFFPLQLFNNIQYKFLDLLVFSKIRKSLAPSLRYFISGGAPLSPILAEFFSVIGIPVLEGYGLTETSAPATVNRLNKIKFGTVGKRLPNIEIKIADDGEILIKGPSIFKAYYKNPEATNEAFIGEWFKTGDIGELDSDEYLRITDRKKDIIVNSAGKKVAPQNLENTLKNSPYISNVVVVGDKRKYLSAIVTLEQSAIQSYTKEYKMHLNGTTDITNHPQIIKLIDEEIKAKTADNADFEQIRKFTILPNDFTVEAGEITPTLKVKRKFVSEKYKNLIDSMYPPE